MGGGGGGAAHPALVPAAPAVPAVPAVSAVMRADRHRLSAGVVGNTLCALHAANTGGAASASNAERRSSAAVVGVKSAAVTTVTGGPSSLHFEINSHANKHRKQSTHCSKHGTNRRWVVF